MNKPHQSNQKPHGRDLIKMKVATLPSAPGVYRMLDENGKALYVGKAKNLKNRVSNYVNATGHNNRILRMIDNTCDMEFIRTETQTDALLLEANLIKKLKPRYNILLRDDKSFPYILIANDHPAPQILKHRGARKRPGAYFGPFASSRAVNETLNALQRAFLLRSCSDNVYQNRSRPCLLYQIKRCSAPCTNAISEDDYTLLVNQAHEFLKGNSRAVQEQLVDQMKVASDTMDFETAATARDRIQALTYIQKQSDIHQSDNINADAIAIAKIAGQSCIQVFFFRAGQHLGNRAYFPRHDKDQTEADILEAFIPQFYHNHPAPKHILISHPLTHIPLLSEALSLNMGYRVQISCPQRAKKRQIIDHAAHNAQEALARHISEHATQNRLLEGVADIFGITTPIQRIEVFDNSHLQGKAALGAMIVAGTDGFYKNQYRKFNIKNPNTTAGDDYAMMQEVFTRRYQSLVESQQDKPDLILIDGGQGQLNIAHKVMCELGLTDITLVAIAKGKQRNAGREKFFMIDRPDFCLDETSPILYYLQRLRDEAHRYAIGNHRRKRDKDMRRTILDDIDGIGAQRKRALLHHFGSAQAVCDATISDLAKVDGIGVDIAQSIYDFFNE